MNTISVDAYLLDGCGRCDKYQTPDCKVHLWTDTLVGLRAILTDTELVETMKWGAPCYTLDGTNVLMIAATVNYCAISFFKGYALEDPEDVLELVGPNARVGRVIKFRQAGDLDAKRDATVAMVQQAIDLQKSGAIPPPPEVEDVLPEELEDRLDSDAELREAFDALTPGRQRSYIFHIGGAKKSATRASRVERCIPKILAGKGFNEY